MRKGFHAHRLFYLPVLGTRGMFNCICCGERFQSRWESFMTPCCATTIHLQAVPTRNNPFVQKHPDALTLEMCGTRAGDLPQDHAHLPGQVALDEGIPDNTCQACVSELQSPTMREYWTPLR